MLYCLARLGHTLFVGNIEKPDEGILVPRPGDSFQVMDTPEARAMGGLAVRDFREEEGRFVVGGKHIEDKVVRMPVGTVVTIDKAFKDKNEIWVIFRYKYHNPNQGEKELRVCALVQDSGLGTSRSYMERVDAAKLAENTHEATQAGLDALKREIEGN